MAVRVDEAGELEVCPPRARGYARAAAPPGRGAGRGFPCALPALAHAGTVCDLLLPLVRHARARRRAGSTGTRTATGRRPTSTRASTRRTGPYSSSDPRVVDAADGGDRRSRRRRGRRLVVGPRLGARTSGCRSCSPRRARGITCAGDPPRAVPGPLGATVAQDLAVPRGARGPRRLRLPPARLRGRGLGGGDARRRRRRPAASPAPSSSASPPRRGFDGFYTYDFINYGGGKFARLCSQAHACTSSARRASGRATTAPRAGETPAGGQRRERRHLRQALDGGARGAARHRHDHELQRVGRGDADRAGPGPARLRRLRRRLGPDRRAPPQTAYLDAHGLLGRPLPLRALGLRRRRRKLARDGDPRSPGTARAAAERADARAAGC